jgi:hypothetical protein
MADSGDSDSDTDINMYKPQKSNVSFELLMFTYL